MPTKVLPFYWIKLIKESSTFDEFWEVWIRLDSIEHKRNEWKKLSKEDKEKYKEWAILASKIESGEITF